VKFTVGGEKRAVQLVYALAAVQLPGRQQQHADDARAVLVRGPCASLWGDAILWHSG
jgi:hypothetical protein